MGKVTSENIGAFYQHYPRVAVVVTAHAGGRDNAMTIAWHTSISKKPPLYGVVVSEGHFTYKLITESKEFGVNFLPDTRAELVAAIGGSKGSELDKFKAFAINKDNPVKTAVPILMDAYAAFECRLVDDRSYGDHRLLIGEIIAVHYLEEAFNADGTLNQEKVSPVLYMGSEQYLGVAGCKVRTLNRELCVERLKG
jgi:flavin reductase (DIM6/NTAB) family NADH-FMN oxidoreductase RutF